MLAKIVNIIMKIKNLSSPRYKLHLEEGSDFYEFEMKLKQNIYKLKMLGEFNILKLTYTTIVQNKCYLYAIDPRDLLKIFSIEKDRQLDAGQLILKEILRENKFKIIDNDKDLAIFSGHEICNNPLLIDRMRKLDVHKVSYMTGFFDGRDFAKNMLATHGEKKITPDLPMLRIVK